MRALLSVLSFVVLLGCGGLSGKTGKPLHEFPSREKLAELASQRAGQKPLGADTVAFEEWTLALPAERARAPQGLLAKVAPRAKATPALDCVAHELARILIDGAGKPPSLGLQRFIAARCGALVSVPMFQSWSLQAPASARDEAILARLQQDVHEPVSTAAEQVGVGLARQGDKAVIVAALSSAQVQTEPFQQIVGDDGMLRIRGRVKLDVDALHAAVNAAEYGVKACELDPAVAPPEFAIRCPLSLGDDHAWVILMAQPRGRVLSQEVLGIVALRHADAAKVYRARQFPEARPVTSAQDFERTVIELVNGVRGQLQLAPLQAAPRQSQTAHMAAPAFFAALTSTEPSAGSVVDGISLGLMAGWDVTGGILRGCNLTASLVVDTLDAGRWLADVLERPIGRSVLLDPEARVLAFGAVSQREPAVLAGVGLTYQFFEDDGTESERALQVLERLARVRKARGLGKTMFVRDAPGMPEQLARVHRGEVTPGEALDTLMHEMVDAVGRDVRGFVWETHDLDAIEFPRELLVRGDLALGAGVTYYRAKGGAWGQYAVLFVVVSVSPVET